MSEAPTESQTPESQEPNLETNTELENPQGEASAPPQGSYVKHAMRNMVRKRGTSLKHFFLTTFGVLGLLVALAYLTR